MNAPLYHVSSTANRDSIREHGLDWARVGAAGVDLVARDLPAPDEVSTPS